MIYLDNAATTLHKPPEVAEAVKNAILTAGNAARGAHGASLSASRSASRVYSMTLVFLRKVSVDSGEKKRAVPEVGRTWHGPAMATSFSRSSTSTRSLSSKRPCGPLAFRRATAGSRGLKEDEGELRGG